jgi:RNA polymerase sigma-70 factor, ECF subfamily
VSAAAGDRILMALQLSGSALSGEKSASTAPVADSARLSAEADADTLWDNELARRVFHDPENFIRLYENYYERILNYLYRRTMNLDEAQDLTSRTFLQAFNALRAREQRLAFRPWLYRIATNAHTSHVRGLCRWAARVREAGMQQLRRRILTPGQTALAREESDAVREALLRLPEKYRVPVVLRYDEELSIEEIAVILRLTSTGARTRIARGLTLLAREFRNHESKP